MCPPPPNAAIMMKHYTYCLLTLHGEDAIVTSGIVSGADNSGEFIDEYISLLLTQSPPPSVPQYCNGNNTIDIQSAQAFVYKWCPHTTIVYGAWRDTWYTQGGRSTLKANRKYDCAVAAEYAAMTPQVKAAICPNH